MLLSPDRVAWSKKGDPPQMMHTTDSLAAELQRLRDRPGADAAPPVLSLFVIDVHGDAAEYVRRLRSAISPAVRLGSTADFEQESLPVDDVPDWFAAVSSQDPEQAPQFAREPVRPVCGAHRGRPPVGTAGLAVPLRPRRGLPRLGVVGRRTGWTVPRPPVGGQLGRVLLRVPGPALGRLRGGRGPRRRPCGPEIRRVVGGAERLALRQAPAYAASRGMGRSRAQVLRTNGSGQRTPNVDSLNLW